jgi:hypothetical protein
LAGAYSGGKRDSSQVARCASSASGRVPGLLMPVPSGPNPGLALEFKSATGRASESQDE